MDVGVATAMGALVGAVVVHLVNAYLQIRRAHHEQTTATHGTTIDEYKQLLGGRDRAYATQKSEIIRLQSQKDQLIERLTACLQLTSRLEERVVSHETLLSMNKIPFRPWISTPLQSGTDTSPVIDVIENDPDATDDNGNS